MRWRSRRRSRRRRRRRRRCLRGNWEIYQRARACSLTCKLPVCNTVIFFITQPLYLQQYTVFLKQIFEPATRLRLSVRVFVCPCVTKTPRLRHYPLSTIQRLTPSNYRVSAWRARRTKSSRPEGPPARIWEGPLTSSTYVCSLCWCGIDKGECVGNEQSGMERFTTVGLQLSQLLLGTRARTCCTPPFAGFHLTIWKKSLKNRNWTPIFLGKMCHSIENEKSWSQNFVRVSIYNLTSFVWLQWQVCGSSRFGSDLAKSAKYLPREVDRMGWSRKCVYTIWSNEIVFKQRWAYWELRNTVKQIFSLYLWFKI